MGRGSFDSLGSLYRIDEEEEEEEEEVEISSELTPRLVAYDKDGEAKYAGGGVQKARLRVRRAAPARQMMRLPSSRSSRRREGGSPS